MARVIAFRGAAVKRRRPWGVCGLGIVTLGVYHLVWWHKLNAELRDYSAAAGRPLGNSPDTSVVALLLGSLVLIPGIWTVVTTTRRVRAVRDMAGAEPGGRPRTAVAVLLFAVFGAGSVYLQSAVNAAWDAAERGAGKGGRPQLIS